LKEPIYENSALLKIQVNSSTRFDYNSCEQLARRI